MEYTIDWIESKVSSKGANYFRATLTGNGQTYEEVSIFGGFKPEDLIPGGKLFGELKEGTWQGKTSYVLNAVQSKPASTFKAKKIEEAVERKEKSITKFQDSKELSIKISSTFRAAVDTAMVEYEKHGGEMSELYEKWREYYWYAFDVLDETGNIKYPPFK